MPKRGENIRKRKDGRWEARIITDTGKTKSIYAHSYREVKEKMKKPPDETVTSFDKSDFTFKDICNLWLTDNEIRNKKSTTAKYKSLCRNHIFPYFENIKPNEIKENHINAFIRQKTCQCTLAAKTIHDIITLLIQIIRYGENNGYIPPVKNNILSPSVPKKELDILTEAEQKTLVNSIKNNITAENIGILLSLFAGLRLGEICALQWGDIDFNNGLISVTKTMQRIEVENKATKTEIIIDTPKSQKSIRKIPIPDFLTDELKLLSRGCSNEAYILTGSKTRFIEPRAYQYKFKKYLKQANIRDINFHSLRHTFATRAIEQQVDVKTLSELLGHSTVNFTLDRYVHPSFNLKKQNIEKLVVCY